ncbi:MAG: hypothetical protein IT385_22640 [Deltaproteobacteria bacterium]|nr:hypothetical protein [Deltaproteobacteria bacterium]
MTRIVALLVSGLCAACAEGSGFVEGPSLEVPDCKVLGRSHTFEPFRMSLQSVAVHEADDVATIRFGAREAAFNEVDQIGLVLYDVDVLQERIAADGEVAVSLVPGQDEQGIFSVEAGETGLMTVVLLDSCPHPTAVIAGVGVLTLTAYGGARNGDPLAGRLAVDLVDRRTGRVLGAGFHGEFDFVVDTSAPFTAFAPKDY